MAQTTESLRGLVNQHTILLEEAHGNANVNWRYTRPSATYVYVKKTRTRNFTRMPGWKQKIRRHQAATNGYDLTASNLTVEPGSATVTYQIVTDPKHSTSYRAQSGGALHLDTSLTAVPTTSMLSEAKTASAAQFNKRYNKNTFQGGPFSGELSETIGLFRHPLSAGRRLLDDLAKGIRRTVGKTPVHLAYSQSGNLRRRGLTRQQMSDVIDQYLEYTYGIAPLIGDAANAGRALAHYANRPLIERTRSDLMSRDITIRNPSTYGTLTTPTGIPMGHETYYEYGATVSVESGGSFLTGVNRDGSGTSSSEDVFDHLGVTLANFVPTVYELIPYSFIIDYFTNIGDIIQAYCTVYRKPVYTFISTKIVTHAKTKDLASSAAVSKTGKIGYTVTGDYGCATRESVLFSRTSGFLQQELQFSIPSAHQLINMSALGVAATQRHRVNLNGR